MDEELLSLLMTSLQLVERLDLEEVMERIISEAAQVVGAQSCSVIMLEENTGECFFFYAATGPKKSKLKKIKFDATLGVAGKVLETGEPMLVPDTDEEPLHLKEIDRKTGMKTRSLICVPLRSAGKMIGVLEAINCLRGPTFTERDLQLLAIFANFAGVAIQNSRTFRRTHLERQAFQSASRRERHFMSDAAAMKAVWEVAERVAPVACTVLLTGESGTGKEVVAAFIHEKSDRRDKPFISVNCAALEENLLNSELFGHERGSFTGAVDRRIGRFELAHTGTLFLDEIAECAVGTQARLLRVLQEQAFQRLGGTDTIRTDARILVATNADLAGRLKAGAFREDLFHRLNVVNIHIPPLRERRQEIPGLLAHFVAALSADMHREPVRFDDGATRLLEDYRWPGNVRELRNFVERVMVLHPEQVVRAEAAATFLPTRRASGVAASSEVAPANASAGPDAPSLSSRSLWDEEKRLIEQALRRHAGNQSAAARALGISRHHLRYRLKKYEINPKAL